ncbi:MAG TPA: LacI family DNA-binding transcriptional regulator [Chitinophagaceae bacterium]|nr:LacI family DNA-binding transcriptional regulator [Chitinophagaceae bacterium]
MDAVNLKKLARQLKLSVSTVSRALRDSHEISRETKEKVLALAAELNYQPNPYASSLRRQKSRTIAVVVPEIANNFFSLAINGIGSVAQEKGYHVLIYLTHENVSEEISIVGHLLSGRVDGVLMSLSSETGDTTHLAELKRKGVPIVFFDRVCDTIETARVTTDDYESGFNATQHLVDQGCRRIAYLLISPNLSIGVKRMQGYLDALKQNSIAVDEQLIVQGGLDNDQNYALIKSLLQRDGRPDGIFASVERLAISTYHVCNDLGLDIPGDVKIISFSNLETASLLQPSLTTVTQPAFDIGKTAAMVLFKGLDKKSAIADEHIILKSALIPRASTGQ